MNCIPMRPITYRDPGPYAKGRRCKNCGAVLSRSNPQPLCAPCNGGDWDPPVQAHPAFAARVEYEVKREKAA